MKYMCVYYKVYKHTAAAAQMPSAEDRAHRRKKITGIVMQT